MRKPFLALLSGALVVVLSVGVGASTAGGASTAAQEPAARGSDNLSSPLAEKQDALRAVGLQKLASGELPQGTKVAQVAKGQYVQLAREGEDSIWTVLGEFGGTGPVHNQIPQPNRSVDNTTIWTSDFSQPYYEDLLFDDAAGQNSMRNYYKEQSSNRYAVNGDVTNWVQVPNNEAFYGNNGCGSIVCSDTWKFVNDSADAWAASMSTAQANAYLAQFDVWDRYDSDGDGNFNEPDGYIDHFQSVHAGDGRGGRRRRAGHGRHLVAPLVRVLHRLIRPAPTAPGRTASRASRIGNTNYWIGDYTIEPENGGVGVFAHEFGHDLGLPDEYDTSRQHRRRRELTAWWTLMSQGSYGTADRRPRHRTRSHMSAWDKFQLGWLNYEVAARRAEAEHQARAGRVQHEAGPGAVRSAAGQGRHDATSGLPTRARTSTTRAPRTTSRRDDAAGDAARRGGDPLGEGPVQHRDRLRLRATSRSTARRCPPASRTRPSTPNGIDGTRGSSWVDLDRQPLGLRGPDRRRSASAT